MFVIAKFEKKTDRKSIKKEFLTGYETREAAAAEIEKIKNRLYWNAVEKYGIVAPYTEKMEDGKILYSIKTGLVFDPDYYYIFHVLEVA